MERFVCLFLLPTLNDQLEAPPRTGLYCSSAEFLILFLRDHFSKETSGEMLTVFLGYKNCLQIVVPL